MGMYPSEEKNEYHAGDRYDFKITTYFTEMANGYVDADNKYLYFIFPLDKRIGNDVQTITITTDLFSASIASHGGAYIGFSKNDVTAYQNGNSTVIMRIHYAQSQVSGGNLPTSGRAAICGRPNECSYCYLTFS